MEFKRLFYRLVSVWSLLLLPWIGSLWTEEVQWKLGDYCIAAILLGSLVVIVELILSFTLHRKYKTLFIALSIFFFVLVWVELAVGLFGSPFAGS